MSEIDWGAVKMYGGYCLAGITTIATLVFTLRRERRDAARAQREEEASKRTASLLWRPNEADIEQIVRQTQAYQARHTPKPKAANIDARKLFAEWSIAMDLILAYASRDLEGDVERERTNGQREGDSAHQAALRNHFPAVYEPLVRSSLAFARAGRITATEADHETEPRRSELRSLALMYRKLVEALGYLEKMVFDIGQIPPDERSKVRARVERALRTTDRP